MPRGGVDPRTRRDRGSEDSVFTYDDWERGFSRYKAHKEDKERERFTGDAWMSYKRWKEWLRSRDSSKEKWRPKDYRNEEEEFEHQFYQYKVDTDRFMRCKLSKPPPKPPMGGWKYGGTHWWDRVL
jgi:hypothetical protein